MKTKFRPYFRVGHKWQHLDSPTFDKRFQAANYAGRFYLVLKWKIVKIGPRPNRRKKR